MKTTLLNQIRNWQITFVICLVLSGLTAIPLETELNLLSKFWFYLPIELVDWLEKVLKAINEINSKHPQLMYGYDWLAFAHLVIAVAFFGSIKDPIKNIWVIEFGMIACLMVLPFAVIMGSIRNVPFWWRIIDCSFGIIGIIPLIIVKRKIQKLISIS